MLPLPRRRGPTTPLLFVSPTCGLEGDRVTDPSSSSVTAAARDFFCALARARGIVIDNRGLQVVAQVTRNNRVCRLKWQAGYVRPVARAVGGEGPLPGCSRDPAVGVRQRSRDRLPASWDWRAIDSHCRRHRPRPPRRLRPRRFCPHRPHHRSSPWPAGISSCPPRLPCRSSTWPRLCPSTPTPHPMSYAHCHMVLVILPSGSVRVAVIVSPTAGRVPRKASHCRRRPQGPLPKSSH